MCIVCSWRLTYAQDIRKFAVVVVGVGGVGSVAAEMLARCMHHVLICTVLLLDLFLGGIGKLLLFDYDTVELANMNRYEFCFGRAPWTYHIDLVVGSLRQAFLSPQSGGYDKDCGCRGFAECNQPGRRICLLRVQRDQNPRLCRVSKHVHSFPALHSHTRSLKTGGKKTGTAVDLVLGCVDNFEARVAMNAACLDADVPWIESGVAENAMSCHVQVIRPGVSACFQCAPPLIGTHTL